MAYEHPVSCLSTWVGYAFYFYMPSEISWRGSYVVFSGLAAVLFVGTIFLPETPRWLIKNGFMEEGLATLVDLQGDGSDNDEKVVLTYQEIVAAIEFEGNIGKSPTWWEIFTQYTRRTVMGITSQMFAQLNGINVSV
jgi:MFS family permease